MNESPYYLSKQTFYCLADNHYVFLNLRSDEYLCLGRTHTEAMKGLLSGHQVLEECSDRGQPRDGDSSGVSATLKALLHKELLVQDLTQGKIVQPLSIDAPAKSLLEHSGKPRRRIKFTDLWNFFAAANTASRNLRSQPIESTVRTVEARKLANTTVIDDRSVKDLCGIFRTLRPYYPRAYLCMFDSLALLHFLAYYGVFPQWIYGVKLEPFGAHCWVQAGNQVLNDYIDSVRAYTPIMAV